MNYSLRPSDRYDVGGSHTPTSVSMSYSSSFRHHPGDGVDDSFELDEESWDLEANAEGVVQALLKTVDSVLYTNELDSTALATVTSFTSPTAAASSSSSNSLPVRFPHRKVVVSYLDECREWSQVFPHMRVQGRSILPQDDHLMGTLAKEMELMKLTRSRRASREQQELIEQCYQPPLQTQSSTTSSSSSLSTTTNNSSLASTSSHTLAGQSSIASALTIIPAPRYHSTSSNANEMIEGEDEEIFASDGTLEETLAQDHSDEHTGPYSSLTHPLEQTDALSTQRRQQEERGYPPFTPERLKQWEEEQERIIRWWKNDIHPNVIVPLVPHVVALIAKTYAEERSKPSASTATTTSSSAPTNTAAYLSQKFANIDDDTGDDEVLFYDGDQSMPNPFTAASTGAAAASSKADGYRSRSSSTVSTSSSSSRSPSPSPTGSLRLYDELILHQHHPLHSTIMLNTSASTTSIGTNRPTSQSMAGATATDRLMNSSAASQRRRIGSAAAGASGSSYIFRPLTTTLQIKKAKKNVEFRIN